MRILVLAMILLPATVARGEACSCTVPEHAGCLAVISCRQRCCAVCGAGRCSAGCKQDGSGPPVSAILATSQPFSAGDLQEELRRALKVDLVFFELRATEGLSWPDARELQALAPVLRMLGGKGQPSAGSDSLRDLDSLLRQLAYAR